MKVKLKFFKSERIINDNCVENHHFDSDIFC